MKTFLLLLCVVKGLALCVSLEVASEIGEKVWKNECGGKREGLTCWNQGEDFPSLGIGHFIWYRKGQKERFEETFPALVRFLVKEGVDVPSWLKGMCPWKSRESFERDKRVGALRELLFETRGLQAVFIANRLEGALPGMLESCSEAEREKIGALFHRLVKERGGLYAMIDYLNFKGAGTSEKERYQGQGWGLLQVLQRVSGSSLVDFVEAAKTTLRMRVENAPPERGEERWLKGWMNRLDTYVVSKRAL